MGNSYVSLFYHIVWTTKNRTPYFSKTGNVRLYAYMKKSIEKSNVDLMAIGGVSNHVHILVKMNTVDSIAAFVRKIKSHSSGFIKRAGNNCDDFMWQKGYSVFSVGRSAINNIRNYIKNQEQHHSKTDFDNEMRIFAKI
jgi:REP element-mobilizing transposase RayT